MSVEKARSGNGWNARWREGGRPRSRLFTLKRDAEAFDREMQRRRQLGPLAVEQLSSRDSITLGQWITDRWAPEHAVTLSQSTRDRYANVYACHIAGALDSVPLRELTVARLRAWQAQLVKSGIQPGTIRKARTFLSSVLRHAAESEQIPANPLSLVRAPKEAHRDAVRPLSPSDVESVRRSLVADASRTIQASEAGKRPRRQYVVPAPGDERSRQRDAFIVSVMAYSGLRPGELRALRWGDVRERTLLVERAVEPDGGIKPTKNEQRRTVRLLGPLAQDLREFRLASGRPPDSALVFPGGDGEPMTKSQWQVWRRDRWARACRSAGIEPTPRPYDLRHGFASLLLAEGQLPLYVARQMGHSLSVLLSTYAHLIDEFEGSERIDAEAEITNARTLPCPGKRSKFRLAGA